MTRAKFPLTAKLLPGLRWSGKMKIEGPQGDGYQVQFDAEIVGAPDGCGFNRIVYDRTVLTAKQVKDWTGLELTP